MYSFAGPLALGLLLVSAPSASAAGSPSSALTMSVQVVRGCTVRTGLSPASLDCGTRGVRVVRVSVDERPAELRAFGRGLSPLPSDAPVRTLTVNF